jgi:hypothetical protein
LYDTFKVDREAREVADTNWETFEKQWEGYYTDELEDEDRSNTDEYRSNVWVPMTYWLTMTAMTELVQQIPNFTMLPKSREDAPLAEIMQEIVQSTLDKGDFLTEWYKLCLTAGIFGTGFLYEYYRCDNREIKELTKFDPHTMKYEYKKKKVKDFNDVYVESVSPYFIYPQATAKSMANCGHLWRRYIIGEDVFHQQYDGKFKNAKLVKPSIDHQNDDPNWKWWDTAGLGYMEDNQVEVLWQFNKTKDELNILANGILLTDMDMPLPYDHKEIPFCSMPWVMRHDRFWGKGMSELLEKGQYERNANRNLALDQARLNILKIFFVNVDEGVDIDNLQLRPGMAIPVKGDPRNAVYPLEYTDLKQSFFKLDDMADQDSVRATGISPELTGASKAESATQAAIMKEATLKRLQMQILLYYKDTLTRLGRLRFKNIQQFYKDPIKVEKIVGENDTEIVMRQYREIRLKEKALAINEDSGDYYLQNNPGDKYTFFQTIPDLFKNDETERFYDFDVVVNPESGVKVSKTLQQEKEGDFYERFKDDPDVDQVKLKEGYMKVMDKNPEELLVKYQTPEMPPGQMPGMPPIGGMPGSQALPPGQNTGMPPGQAPMAGPLAGMRGGTGSPASNRGASMRNVMPNLRGGM